MTESTVANSRFNPMLPTESQLQIKHQCYRLAIILIVQGALFITFGFICLALIGFPSYTNIFFHSFWAGVTNGNYKQRNREKIVVVAVTLIITSVILTAGVLGVGTFKLDVKFKSWLCFYTTMTSIASVVSLVGLVLCCIGTSIGFTIPDWPSIGINMLECSCYLVAFLICLKSLIYYCRYSSEQRYLDSVQGSINAARLQDNLPPYSSYTRNIESSPPPTYNDVQLHLATTNQIDEDTTETPLYEHVTAEENIEKEDPPPPYTTLR